MESSEQLNELATALCKAQAKIEGAKKENTNPAFKSRYADLNSVWEACRKPLNDAGLSVTQTFEPGPEGHLMLRITLLHTSGQWLSGVCCMPLHKCDPQGYGSAATYARRYTLAALVGVCPEDDDGNAASGQGQQQPREKEQWRQPTQPQARFSPPAAPPTVDPKALQAQLAAAYKLTPLPQTSKEFYDWMTEVLERPVTPQSGPTATEMRRLIDLLEAEPDPWAGE